MGFVFHGAERLLECALVFLAAWIYLGVLFATTALLQGMIVAFGVPLSWQVCLGLLMRMPLQMLAFTAAVEGSVVGQVLWGVV